METWCDMMLVGGAAAKPFAGAIIATFSASCDQEIGLLPRVIQEAELGDEQEN